MIVFLIFIVVLFLTVVIATHFTQNFDKIFYAVLIVMAMLSILIIPNDKDVWTTQTRTQYLKLNAEGHTQYSTRSGGINTTIYTVKTTNGKSIDVSNPTVTYNQTKRSKIEITKLTTTSTLFGFKTGSETYENSTIYIIK